MEKDKEQAKVRKGLGVLGMDDVSGEIFWIIWNENFVRW